MYYWGCKIDRESHSRVSAGKIEREVLLVDGWPETYSATEELTAHGPLFGTRRIFMDTYMYLYVDLNSSTFCQSCILTLGGSVKAGPHKPRLESPFQLRKYMLHGYRNQARRHHDLPSTLEICNVRHSALRSKIRQYRRSIRPKPL